MIPHAYLFVDGSASSKDRTGAWAAVAVSGDRRKLLYGSEYPTTISRCELLPIIGGLRWIGSEWAISRKGWRVAVFSDSQYTVKTLSGMYERKKNLDLWAGLDEAAKGLDTRYFWRERNTLPYMEVCDAVCGYVRRTCRDGMAEIAGAGVDPIEAVPWEDVPYDTDDLEITE